MTFPPRYHGVSRALGLGVAGLAVCSFALAFFLPIYTDEIVWKMMQGRLFIDGGTMLIWMLPSCGEYIVPSSWFFLPFRWLDAILYGALATPLAIRVYGLVLALSWLGLAAYCVTAICRDRAPRGIACATLLAFTTLGVMPFLLVLSRPEQTLLIGITCFLAPLLLPSAATVGTGQSALRACAGTLLAAFILAAHPRAIFALPLMLVFLWRMAQRPWIAGTATIATLIYAVGAYHDWTARMVCPDDPQYASAFATFNISTAVARGGLPRYLSLLLDAMTQARTYFLAQFVPSPGYTSNLLPGFAAPMLADVIRVSFAAFVVVGFLAYLWILLARRAPRTWLTLIGIGSLWLFYAASVIARLDKNDYEAALIQPVMTFAALSSLWIAWPYLMRKLGARPMLAIARTATIGLFAVSIASQTMMLGNYLPDAWNSWRVPGETPDQRYSISAFGYDEIAPQIRATAQLCGIDPAARPRRLVVDELTSFVFRDGVEPYLMTFFDSYSWGRGRDPQPFWQARGVSGLIVDCDRVPAALTASVRRNGPFCCHPAFTG